MNKVPVIMRRTGARIDCTPVTFVMKKQIVWRWLARLLVTHEAAERHGWSFFKMGNVGATDVGN